MLIRLAVADTVRAMVRPLLLLALVVACGGVSARFPADVQTALAHDDMRRLETERFIIYYPAPRRAEVDRFLARADRCAQVLRDHAVVKGLEKMVVVMPDIAFNNAFVAPEALGYEPVSVIPTYSTLDFATAFGLPPDPGYIACHELTHYVHFQQVSGFWKFMNKIFGYLYTPQLGYDPWMDEGVATHYEARLSPGLGRPVWPIFTGMFAAAYAGRHVSSGELSIYARNASVGHHYLVGSMFIRFLVERYGEKPLWETIASEGRSLTGWFFTGTFKSGFSRSFSDLIDEFDLWARGTFPVRPRPAAQRALATIGNDARYARAKNGIEAWVAEDVDSPTRLIVRDASGATLLDTSLVDVLPLRKLVIADPLLASGLSITADGGEVWLTAIDLGSTFQVTRLLRWRRGDRGLTEVATDLGPGATIDPTGATYYYCAVDGDRWSLAAYDTRTNQRRIVHDMTPGTYILGAQISPDGKQLAANVWDGNAFVIWFLDAATGKIVDRQGAPGTPAYDASYTTDGRRMWLGVVDGRFQVFVEGTQITDAPYAVLGAREANGTIRFLDRERWEWELDEIALPPPPAPPAPAAPASENEPPVVTMAPPPTAVGNAAPAQQLYPSQPLTSPPSAEAVAVTSDQSYSIFDHLFFPQVRSPTLALASTGVPHLGLVLGGGDRLYLQRWAIAGYVQPKIGSWATKTHFGANASYLNNMLSPVQILGQVGFLDWVDPVETDDPDVFLSEEHRTRDASLIVGGAWRGTLTATLGAGYTDDYVKRDAVPEIRRHVAGPTVSAEWLSPETTRYTGVRRALLIAAQGAYYPRQLSSFMGDITDVGGTLGAVVPLPFTRRHIISAFVRERALVAGQDTGLLQVGGDSAQSFLWNRRSTSMEPPAFDETRFPPNLRFVEPLRGYEDYAITTDRVTLGELDWRYPIIIDRGTAALWFLPACYLRQLDLELFAAGAIDKANDKHYAVGAAITVQMQFLRIPLGIRYQIARRLIDDEALTQFVGFTASP